MKFIKVILKGKMADRPVLFNIGSIQEVHANLSDIGCCIKLLDGREFELVDAFEKIAEQLT